MPEIEVHLDGLRLHVEEHGSGAPLLLLHGFTGSAAAWHPHTERFGEHYRTLAVDLIGHGRSDAPAELDRYRMERCVADIASLLDRLGVERTAVLGYSMGGRVALHLAASAPGRVAALVLESASPGIADPAERAARRAADEALADDLERYGIEAFVDRWEALPLFASQRDLPGPVRDRVRRQRLANRPDGLARSLRGMGTGAMEPLHDRLPRLTMPTLIVVGERDEKFCRLGSEMAAALPRARLVVVPGAGHNVHLEKPEGFQRLVLDFLQRHYPAR